MSGSKKYGLILNEKPKPKPVFQAARNVFGDDSDSDKESLKNPVHIETNQSKSRQIKAAQEKAVSEDPTVYQYDEIYDSMANIKKEKIIKNKEEKKPKYIENLIKSANKRKIENERRVERQIQKDREKEGDEFADKEVFVTSAYKKKLQELQMEEEKEKHEEYLETIGDVTKQGDLGGFYRHLYEQKLGPKQNFENKSKGEADSETLNVTDKIIDRKMAERKDTKKRNYRKQNKSTEHSSPLSDGEIEESDEEVNRVNFNNMRSAKKLKPDENIDADSDFSIDESSDEENTNKLNKSQATLKEPTQIMEDNKEASEDKLVKEELNRDESTPPLELKLKIDPWSKRTTGDVFDQALKRYYERKSARGY